MHRILSILYLLPSARGQKKPPNDRQPKGLAWTNDKTFNQHKICPKLGTISCPVGGSPLTALTLFGDWDLQMAIAQPLARLLACYTPTVD